MSRKPFIHEWINGRTSRWFWNSVVPGDVILVREGIIFCNTIDGGPSGGDLALEKGEHMMCISNLNYPFPITIPNGRLLQFINGRMGIVGIRVSAKD